MSLYDNKKIKVVWVKNRAGDSYTKYKVAECKTILKILHNGKPKRVAWSRVLAYQ